MIVITGHYDGRVIVPHQPIPLPAGTRVRIDAHVVETDEQMDEEDRGKRTGAEEDDSKPAPEL